MKLFSVMAVLLLVSQGHAVVGTPTAAAAAIKTENVSNDEIQAALDDIGDDIVLEKSDEEFLNEQGPSSVAQKIQEKDGIVWGKAIVPVKKAEASPAEKNLKK